MTDIQGLDWAHTMDIALLVGVVFVTVILLLLAFFYLRANRNFDLSLKSLGSQEDLAEINRQILAKKDELERLEKQEGVLRNNINDLNSKQATVDQVTSELNQLGLQYSQKRNELAELEQKLVKSKALQEFVESHQKDQLSEIERLIEEKQKRLDELTSQINEQNGTKVMGDALKNAFNAIGEELSDLSGAQATKAQMEQEINDLKSHLSELQAQKNDISQELDDLAVKLEDHRIEEQVGKTLGSVFDNLAGSLNEQVSNSFEALGDEIVGLQEMSSQKTNLTQEVEKLQEQIDELEADRKRKAEELEELENQVSEHKLGEQVEQSLGEVFENLAGSLNEQVSNSFGALGEEITGLQQISSQKASLEQDIADLSDTLKKLDKEYQQKKAELEKLNDQADSRKVEQQVEEQVGQSLSDAFTRLSDSINESMIGLGSDLSQVLELSAQRQKLETENQLLAAENQKLAKKLSGKGETKEKLDEAYKELETEPEQIKTFLGNFKAAKTTNLSETKALEQFMHYLRARKLYYPQRVIKAFHTALKIQAINPLAVLAGVSGTGKTQLALQYAKFFGFYSEHVAVQPRWDSKDDLLGFYNFLEKKFQPTALVRALFRFDKYKTQPKLNSIQDDSPMMMAILDEMNLARVEYYFSEFLSKLELRGSDYEKSVIEVGSNLNPRQFYVGSNVVIVGTMNDDESTYALSDKVLDRANVLHFGKPGSFEDSTANEKVAPIKVDFKLFHQWRQVNNLARLVSDDKEQLKKKIEELNEALNHVGKPFGHRVNNSINAYLSSYPLSSDTDVMTTVKLALADQIEMKIIPKLAGLEQNDHSNDCLNLLSRVIDFTDDDALKGAFNVAYDNYNSEGMFIWRGITRSLDD